MARARVVPRDPLSAAYGTFCARLARIGFTRGASEAPLAFAERVCRLRGDLADEVRAITRLYGLVFALGAAASMPQLLRRRQVKNFKGRPRFVPACRGASPTAWLDSHIHGGVGT